MRSRERGRNQTLQEHALLDGEANSFIPDPEYAEIPFSVNLDRMDLGVQPSWEVVIAMLWSVIVVEIKMASNPLCRLLKASDVGK